MTTLTFNNTTLTTINQDKQIWLTSSDLAKALGYKQADSITKIFNRNKDEFSPSMSQTVNSTASADNKGLTVKTRIFSLRGCHLIAMFARTKVAKDFRVWVLNVLDNEVGQSQPFSQLTPTQTLPLRNAVNGLVTKAGIMYPDAYKMIHQQFNVDHIKQLKPEEIGKAVEYVHRLILTQNRNPNFNLEYINKMVGMGSKKVDEINHAVKVAEKHLSLLEHSLDALSCSIEVIKSHNATNHSVFESLRWQAPQIN